jgi:hypothetical protein
LSIELILPETTSGPDPQSRQTHSAWAAASQSRPNAHARDQSSTSVYHTISGNKMNDVGLIGDRLLPRDVDVVAPFHLSGWSARRKSTLRPLNPSLSENCLTLLERLAIVVLLFNNCGSTRVNLTG